jgi:hypothetical protein
MGQSKTTGCISTLDRLKESVVEELCSDFEVKVEGLGRIEEKEDFLKICLTRFHPTHYIPLAIKYSLAQVRSGGYFISIQ